MTTYEVIATVYVHVDAENEEKEKPFVWVSKDGTVGLK
jgi:hypothetical protein|tara:strand:- start:70 stop:183 length:114 start_codon:yes stop_codon:yes gene_type:complete